MDVTIKIKKNYTNNMYIRRNRSVRYGGSMSEKEWKNKNKIKCENR